MKSYDPDKPIDPQAWLALDEDEQTRLVKQYHRKSRIKLPNAEIHAAIHVAVENQIAMGDERPVEKTLHRLMSEGLDRHDAIHCIASVLAEYMFDLLLGTGEDAEIGEEYFAQLEVLDAQEWLRSFDE
ncbi:MAG: DUF1841 family protein [Planctomycetota bacterium]|nr:DUF1841 family protein [Planctomycetota bacterium]MDA1214317.1 DUF1841 family protein [Planctomycetota bacterium]